jgi:hypothetical protein
MNENAPREDADADADDRPVHHETSPPDPDSDGPALVGTLVRYDDAPDEYTVHPPDAAEPDLLTTWLTVEREDLVDLDGMR